MSTEYTTRALADITLRTNNPGNAPVPTEFTVARDILEVAGKCGHHAPCIMVITKQLVQLAGTDFGMAVLVPPTPPVYPPFMTESPTSYLPTPSESPTEAPSIEVGPPNSPVSNPLDTDDTQYSPLTMPPPLLPAVLPNHQFTFSRPRADTPYPITNSYADTAEATTMFNTITEELQQSPLPADDHGNFDMYQWVDPETGRWNQPNGWNMINPATGAPWGYPAQALPPPQDDAWTHRSLTPYTESEIERSWEDTEKIPFPEFTPMSPSPKVQSPGTQLIIDAIATANLNPKEECTATTDYPVCCQKHSDEYNAQWRGLPQRYQEYIEEAMPRGPVRKPRISIKTNPYPIVKIKDFAVVKCGLCDELGHPATTCKYARRCSICDNIGHVKESCPVRQQRCWHCRSRGHLRHNCPARSLSAKLFRPLKNSHYYRRRDAAEDALRTTIRFLKNHEHSQRSHGSTSQAQMFASLLKDANRRLDELKKMGITDGFAAV